MQIGDLVEVTAYCDNKHLHGKRGVVLASLAYDSYLVWLDGKNVGVYTTKIPPASVYVNKFSRFRRKTC